MNTGSFSTNIYDASDNNFNYSNAYISSRDFSGAHFDTSNVKKFDNFLYSTKLEYLDISGMDFKGIENNEVTVTGDGNYTVDSSGKRTKGYAFSR
ncbi:MAG: hypothetical protein IJG87_06070 [Ruminococcus sp.]|nr:hypothetical protein [Ruminococcus sp.]